LDADVFAVLGLRSWNRYARGVILKIILRKILKINLRDPGQIEAGRGVISLTESNYLARFLSNHDAASRR
jgi:hypothetical protein